MRLIHLGLGLALVGLSVGGAASGAPAYGACIDRADGDSERLRLCIDAEFARQDQRLNSVYRDTLQRLPADRAAALRRQQRAWLAARDPGCRAEAADNAGGSLEAVIFGQCRVAATARRADAIARRAEAIARR